MTNQVNQPKGEKMGMFRTLLNDFKGMFGTPDAASMRAFNETNEPFAIPDDWMPDEPDRVFKFAHDEADMETPHMAKVTIDRAGNATVETGTMTYDEVAAAASEFRRVANKLAHEASQMKKRAYREAKKWERQSP